MLMLSMCNKDHSNHRRVIDVVWIITEMPMFALCNKDHRDHDQKVVDVIRIINFHVFTVQYAL